MSVIKLPFDEREKVKERLARRLKIQDDRQMEWLWDEVFGITENLAGREVPPLGALVVALGIMSWTASNTGMPSVFIREFIEHNWQDLHYLAQHEHDDYQKRRVSLDFLDREQ